MKTITQKLIEALEPFANMPIGNNPKINNALNTLNITWPQIKDARAVLDEAKERKEKLCK